jgi:CysZ protein
MQKSGGSIGFLDGLAAPWGGLKWVLVHPAVWPLAIVPGILFVLLLAGVLAGCVLLEEHFLSRWWGEPSGTWQSILYWMARVAGWIVAVLAGFLAALVLAQPISGPALDALAKRRETDMGVPPHPDSPILPGIWRSLRVSLFGLAVTLPALLFLSVVGMLFPFLAPVTVPLNFILTGLMLAWDLVDYPLGLRSSGIRDRLSWFRRNTGAAMGLGISLWILFFIPGAAILLLGVGVAGATRLVVDSERAGRS